MNLIVVTLCTILASFTVFAFSPLFGKFCARRGAVAPTESIAKMWAAIMRGSEVVIAVVLLYVMWHYVLPIAGPPKALSYIIAGLGTLYIGGVYVVGSFFALVTIPLGNQKKYFGELLEKMSSIA
jgi:hypothetical protein